jgi:hypothetical protein
MKGRLVIIDSMARDVHAHAIGWALEQMGVPRLAIFGDNFPSRATVDLWIDSAGRSEIIYRGPEGEHRLTDEDEMVFLTRRCVGPVLPSYVASDDRDAAQRESSAQLRGMRDLLASFDGCVAVNDLAAKQRANSKPLQLRVARQCGMNIPSSLFSNHGASVREFVAAQAGGAIYKTNTPVGWQRPKEEGGVTAIMSFSRIVQAGELPGDRILRISGGIYQSAVPKEFEVRITVMGSTCFGSKLHSQELSSTRVDWRAGQDFLRTDRLEIPESIASACTEYLRRMGLVFGCFDFIVTPDGNWVFLECNEHGQWLWQETSCPDLPLLDAFAHFMCNPSISFRYNETSKRLRFDDYLATRWQQDWREMLERNVTLSNPFFTIEGKAAIASSLGEAGPSAIR